MSMKATSGISLDNAAVAATPKHLLQFAVDQRYDDYTPVDHAVWRFIMRQNTFFLREYAHKVYFKGLLATACDMRQVQHIEYTQTSYIVHDAAGHAPMMVGREYSNDRQRLGEGGAR